MTIDIHARTNRPRVVIVGAGFGGLRAARRLMKHDSVQVTLVDRNNYHLFQPLLYQVATAGISPDGIAYPVRTIFRGHQNAAFQMAEVQAVDFDRKILNTNTIPIPYDYLIFAVGGETNFFGLQSVARNAFDLKGLPDASAIRNHLLCMFEQAVQERDPAKRSAMLTFVIVGGGPTGVECAGAISELVRLVASKEYPGLKPEEVRVVLLEAAGRLLAAMPEDLSQVTLETLRRKHVEVQFGAQVVDYDGRCVTLKDGQQVPARTLIWAAGVQAAELANRLGAQQARQKRVVVEPTLQLPGRPEVYVIGDAAYLEDDHGQPLPMVAPVAMQQADRAAKNILAQIEGSRPQPFKYRDPGTLATIGRNQAVAWIGGFKFRGFPAWLVWLFVHLMQLVGHRNRIIVLINWIWDYIFYERAIRLITSE